MSDGHHRHDPLLIVDHVQGPVLTPARAAQLFQRRIKLLAQPVRVLGYRPGRCSNSATAAAGGSRFIPRRAAAVNTTA